MSSPRAAIKTTRRPTANGHPRAAVKPAPAKPAPSAASGAELSSQAIGLARTIEREFTRSENVLSAEAIQTLMTALCRVYSAQVEGGARFTPIPEGQVVSPTGVMLTASGLLRAANLAVFELGMWQSWTGR